MEYLMTYGWAILIVAVVLAALYQIGVFNGGNFAPKAQPGACEVQRTSAAASLTGECLNMMPLTTAQVQNGGYILINSPSEFPVGYQPISVFMWVRTPTVIPGSDSGSGQSLNLFMFGNAYEGMGCRQGNDTTLELWNETGFAGHNNNILCAESACSYSVPVICESAVKVNDDKWHFVGMTYNGEFSSDGVTLYVDGAAQPSHLQWGVPGPDVPNVISDYVYIGGTNGGSYRMSGGIADVQVYNTTLSPDEVLGLYQEGIGGDPVRPQNLVGWWPLNGNFNDYSGNGNDGSSGSSVNFNGTYDGSYTAP
jgi:hypothetical protein